MGEGRGKCPPERKPKRSYIHIEYTHLNGRNLSECYGCFSLLCSYRSEVIMKLEVVVETSGGVIIALSKGINFSWGDISWARKTVIKVENGILRFFSRPFISHTHTYIYIYIYIPLP